MGARSPSFIATILLVLAACPGGSGTSTGTATTAATTEVSTAGSTSASTAETAAVTTAGSTSATSAASTESETGGGLPGCACILDEEPADLDAPPAPPTCGEPSCPLVSGACADSYCDVDVPFVLADPAALTCALSALRDRTPGIVAWSFSEGAGIHLDDGYVLVNPDGTAVRRSWSREDLSFEVSDAVVGDLRPPSFYETCLGEADDLARFDCLRAALASSSGACDEGWSCPDCI